MSLNIKNERTHALVRRLAELTGQSQTAAVEDAVARRLAEVESLAPVGRVDTRWADVQRLLVDYRADLSPQDRARIADADSALYDDLGLPR
ncbi:type II toxin-antitoxin system VapB family antitoxin [Cellulomonas sp. S1-8]|uniref:type II toxin-antitoxin system VapB family antitoxin n=1 Tax=Cellulomonas sp. S1-8 TaxID=2904790 RepID=UPI0022433ED7|nr:type II toxin-antitoxin system VapB family antitoxin [Cellulomonas sp. S1-8]UZN03935.1 type II toxin-antitoxin system VapB family antitoxin [Cellulomonas sp. S1-8]